MQKQVTNKSIREWPRGFLDHLFGDPKAMPELPVDFDGSLAYALSTLDERTRQMIEDRFKHRLILDDIASKHHVTRERVRQIIAKGMRRLRHPYRRRFIEYGVSAVLIHEKSKAAQKARERAEIEVTRKCLLEQADDPAAYTKKAMENLFEISVDALGLSVRASNCLHRARRETVGAVLSMSSDELSKVRNLGVKTHDEIVAKLKSMGFTVEHLRRKE